MHFDVFLSHNSKDKPTVYQLARQLQARGLKVWLDEWELTPGRPWQEAIEDIIKTTNAAAVLVGKDGLGPWEEPEMRACLQQFVKRKLPVIPVLLPGVGEQPDLPIFLQALAWVDLRCGLSDEGLDRLVWGITGRKRDPLPDHDYSGYYDTSWSYTDDVSNEQRQVADIVRLVQNGDLVSGEVYFTNDKRRKYRFEGKKRNDGRISGQWENMQEYYEGDFALYPIEAEALLVGYCSGVDKRKTIQQERWKWRRITGLDQVKSNQHFLFDRLKHQVALLAFVEKLKTSACERCVEVDRFTLQLGAGVFSPHCGEISMYFYHEIVAKNPAKTVLDMCTGIGLYALRAARDGAKTVGIDISSMCIQNAQVNARKNGVKSVEFREGNMYEPLKAGEQFDVIFANLPFTSPSNCEMLRGTPYFQMLSLDPNLLKEFILGAPSHLNSGGRLYFTFGTSGDIDHLELLKHLSPLEWRCLEKIERPEIGEAFFIYKLSKN